MKTLLALTGASLTALAIVPNVADAAAATKTLPSVAPATTALPPPPPIEHGPAITGLCLFSEGDANLGSLYGKGIEAQMKSITDAASTEVAAAQAKYKQAADALQAKQATTPMQEYTLAATKLSFQEAELRTLVAQRNQEIDQTEAEPMQQFGIELEKAVYDAYQKNKCSVLIDRSAILMGNLSMDLTKAVIANLDASKPSITFARKNLPPPAQLTAAEAIQAAARAQAQQQGQ